MRTDGNRGAKPTYWPNSKGAWMDRNEALIEPPLEVEGDATWWDHRVDDDHYEQPGNLFRKMSPDQQQALFDNTARALGRSEERSVGKACVSTCRTRGSP